MEHNEYLELWRSFGEDDPTRLKNVLRQIDDRMSTLLGLFESFALMEALDAEEWATEDELSILLEIPIDNVRDLLHAAFQADTPWVEGKQTSYGETWLWRSASKETPAVDEPKYSSLSDRKTQAFYLLKRLGLETRRTREEMLGDEAENGSPAVAMALAATWSLEKKQMFEDGILSILKRKKPVWAGAVGFDHAYESCLERARIAKQVGIENVDPLTEMHCYAGAGMFECHSVLVLTTEQMLALPTLPNATEQSFLAEMELPMRPYFLDFTGSPGKLNNEQPLPTVESAIAKEEHVAFVGCLLDQHNWCDGVLLICPFVLYNVDTPGGGISTLGMIAVNQTDDPNHIFTWGGQEFMFSKGDRTLAMIPTSQFTDEHPELLPEYRRLMAEGGRMAVDVLYMLSSANVTTIPRTLERRVAKRAEKRGWPVAEVVHVHRTKRRYEKTGEMGEGREFTHQFDVVAHERHFTRGPHVWCRVCQGKEIPGMPPCTTCKGTGLDPEKVKPCHRIDESTGEKTCPNGCRREFVPQHVRGPEDAPYIPKVRKLV